MPPMLPLFLVASFTMVTYSNNGGGIIFKWSDRQGKTQRMAVATESALHLEEMMSEFLSDKYPNGRGELNVEDIMNDENHPIHIMSTNQPTLGDQDINSLTRAEYKNKFRISQEGEFVAIQTANLDDKIQVFACHPLVAFTVLHHIQSAVRSLARLRH